VFQIRIINDSFIGSTLIDLPDVTFSEAPSILDRVPPQKSSHPPKPVSDSNLEFATSNQSSSASKTSTTISPQSVRDMNLSSKTPSRTPTSRKNDSSTTSDSEKATGATPMSNFPHHNGQNDENLHQWARCTVIVKGMTCGSCTSHVQKGLEKMTGLVRGIYFIDFFATIFNSQGVKKAIVALIAGKAEVFFDSSLVTSAEIVTAVEQMGYGASVAEDSAQETGKLEVLVGFWCF